MSDETEEEAPSPPSSLHGITRKFTYVAGIFILIWVLLAKNIPSVFTPHSQAVIPNHETTPKAPPVETEAEEKPAAPALPNVDREHIAQLEDQVTSLKKELSDIKKQLGDYANTADLDKKLDKQAKAMEALKSQLDELQDGSAQQLTAVTAFSILKEAALRGEPFEAEFNQIGGLLHNPEQKSLLANLKPYAAAGIATLPALKNHFDKTLPGAVSGHTGTSLASSFQSLIVIRKEGEQQQGSDDESVLARAEAKIDRGEVVAALKEVQALSPAAKDIFADWIKNANAYLDAHKALEALQLALLSEDKKTAAVAPAPVAAKAVEKTTPPVAAQPKSEITPVAPTVKKPVVETDKDSDTENQ